MFAASQPSRLQHAQCPACLPQGCCSLAGNHLPFRRLCASFGAEVTYSEMAFARQLLKGDRKELAILRRAENEKCYGE